MKKVTYYDLNTGAITGTLIGSDYEIEQNLPKGNGYIDDNYDYNFYYVSDGKVAEKKEMVVRVQGMKITQLPNPTYVTVDRSEYTVTDGEFEFSSNLPGPYRVTLKSPKYLDKEVELQ